MNTRDLGLTISLTALGFNHEHYDVDERGRITFCFADSREVRQITDDFFANRLFVPALGFVRAQMTIKNLVHSIRRDRQGGITVREIEALIENPEAGK